MFDRGRIRRLAHRYAERGKLREAVSEQAKIVELEPTDLTALHELFRLETRLGNPVGAARALARMGERLVARGWRLAAIYRYRKLCEVVAPLSPSEQAPFAEIPDVVLGLRAAADEQRREVKERDRAALNFEKAGREADAVLALGRLTELEPDNPVFRARLAEAFCRLGDVGEALPEFRISAEALIQFERTTDALRVLERILHFRADPDDALLAAELYLARGERDDPPRALAKLQACIAADPERLDALALLSRAFDALEQPARAVQVRIELTRLAKAAGDTELAKDLLSVLVTIAPDDPRVIALAGRGKSRRSSAAPPAPSSAPRSARSSVVSVTDDDLAPMRRILSEQRSRADASVLEDLSFEELSEVWVNPVVSKQARRALDDADAFVSLRLLSKAEYVLRVAVEEDPVCAELREALRGVLKARGDVSGFVAETVALGDLYGQRRFYRRARTLAEEALGADPEDEVARAFSSELELSMPLRDVLR